MHIKQQPIDNLTPYANNARTHSDEQVAQIAASIQEFGFNNPVLVDSNNSIIAGHGRVLAARILELDKVPTIKLDHMSEAQRKAYILADNKLAMNAGWDDVLLKLELGELINTDFDIGPIGFSSDEIDAIMFSPVDGLTDEDAVPELPENAVTQVGDVWLMGNHRLVCGDATDEKVIDSAVVDAMADIAFTSPPYNVGKTPNGNESKYKNSKDNIKQHEYKQFLNNAVLSCLRKSDFVFLNVQSVAGNKVALIEHLYDMRANYADTIIWDKESAEPAMARRVLNSRFEYVHIFSNEAKRVIGKRDFRGTVQNIVSINSRQDKKNSNQHKATFPVLFAEHFVSNFAINTCLDPFVGTGTTIIACEKIGVECYAVELDESYVDIAVQRWQDYTGKSAILESTGQTYEDRLNDKAPRRHRSNAN